MNHDLHVITKLPKTLEKEANSIRDTPGRTDYFWEPTMVKYRKLFAFAYAASRFPSNDILMIADATDVLYQRDAKEIERSFRQILRSQGLTKDTDVGKASRHRSIVYNS